MCLWAGNGAGGEGNQAPRWAGNPQEIRTWVETKSRALNRLSHPCVLTRTFFSVSFTITKNWWMELFVNRRENCAIFKKYRQKCPQHIKLSWRLYNEIYSMIIYTYIFCMFVLKLKSRTRNVNDYLWMFWVIGHLYCLMYAYLCILILQK